MKNAIFLVGFSLLLLSCTSAHKINDDVLEISSQDIIKLLKSGKTINIKGKTITGDLDFTAVQNKHQIAPQAYLSEIVGSIYFDNCVFEGNILGFRKGPTSNYMCTFKSDLIFTNCRIKGIVDLQHARFKGYFTFSQNQVEGNFLASNAIMSDHIIFNETHFEQDFSVSNSQFLQRSNFMTMHIEGKTYLQGSAFHGQSLWSNTTFAQYVDFTKVIAHSSFFLDHCEFLDQLYISGSYFWGHLNIASAQFANIFTIRTSTFIQTPIIAEKALDSLKSEKNRILTDENLDFNSMNK